MTTSGASRRRLQGLELALGHRFGDPLLLELALTHRSEAYERGTGAHASYERLEFLGDALLGMIVSDWLYKDDPAASEGLLSRRRQAVVRSSTLARAAHRLGLGDAIRLGRGEELTGGRQKTSLLGDVFEAVLGAIYVDGGLRSARAFAKRSLGPALRETQGALWASGDFKTRLQETAQSRLQGTPRYRIVSATGPDHAREFLVDVRVGERVLGRGAGPSRKRAEQEAAREALEFMDGEDS